MSKRALSNSGPFLTAAFFCEGVREDTPGSISIHRIIDSLYFPLGPNEPADAPSDASPIVCTLVYHFAFKTNKEDGKHHLKLTFEPPRSEQIVLFDEPIEVEIGQLGFTLNSNVTLHFRSTGRHWTRVELDGELMTKTLLDVFVRRTSG